MTNEPQRQFVAVEFNPWDRRSYTYHNEGPPVAIGDKVRVATKDGEKTVTVVGLPDTAPAFETKAILGRDVSKVSSAEN